MIRTILLAALLAAVGLSASGRPRLRTEKGPDGKSLTFYLEDKDYPGTMTVIMNFTEMRNCDLSDGVQRIAVRHSGQQLLTLRPQDNRLNIGYKLSWRSVPGAVDPKVDSTFVYRMPCPTGRPVKVYQTVYVLDKYTRERADRRHLGYTFLLEKGDTVCAMRRGVVTKIEESEVPEQERFQYRFTSRCAKITVEHPDGTWAWYVNFDPDCMLVGVGDEVLPGTPLGLVGSYDGEKYRIAVQLLWYETDPNAAPDALPVLRRQKMRFATAEGIVIPPKASEYTPVMTDEMLTCEMTKKEAKRLRAGNK